MTARPRRLLAGAGAALALLAAGLAWAPPAAAQSSCDGVHVVVDFAAANADADPSIGCATRPSNGIDALADAGFDVAEVGSFPGLVCQIDGLPDTDCASAPPPGKAWSYWRAGAGDTEWTFSTVGAADAVPGRGDLEGWVFGDGTAPPSISPDQATAAEADHDDEPASEERESLTWVIAIVLLIAIGGLVIWRLRAGKRA